jgi:hypothetical protein
MAWNRSVSSLDHQECSLQNLILGIPVNPVNQEEMYTFASVGRMTVLMVVVLMVVLMVLMAVLMALIIALKTSSTFRFQSKNIVVISLKNWLQDSISCSKEGAGHSTVVISAKGIVQGSSCERNLQRLVIVELAIVVFQVSNFLERKEQGKSARLFCTGAQRF